MRHIKSYKLFEDKTPKYKDMPTLYQDENLVVKVVKTFEAAVEQGKGTRWCSNNPGGFHSHNLTANMYRFNFKDGFKLRLTWDYITQTASELGQYSGGTHWGQGGIVNGEEKPYHHIRPKDDSHPFDFDYKKVDDRSEMVERIQSIPEKAQESVYDYQEKHSKEKNYQLNTLYKEIEKIKVIDAEKSPTDIYELKIDVTVEYLGKKYIITQYFFEDGSYYFETKELGTNFKKRYLDIGSVLSKYLNDKTMNVSKEIMILI